MVETFYVDGFSDFMNKISNLEKKQTKILYVYFTGKKDGNGKSWCPDCNDAEPFVKNALIENGKTNATIVIVDVGDRTEWKNQTNPFRTNRDTHLMVIPTLINWNEKSKRLEGEQLLSTDLIELFLEQDE